MSPDNLQLSILTRDEDYLALAPVWDRLLECSAMPTPFLTWDWLNFWWQCFGAGRQLRIGVVKDSAGEVHGIAPFMLTAGIDGGRRHLRHLTFLGGLGDVPGETCDLIIPKGQEATIAPLLAQVITMTQGQWDLVELPMLASNSANLPALQSALASCGTVENRFQATPSYHFDLPPTWQQVLDAQSTRTRRYHRDCWAKMEATPGSLITIADEAEHLSALSEVHRLHAMRFDDSRSTFIRPGAIDFHERLVKLWQGSGRCIFPLIHLNGQVAAARYGFTQFGRYWDYQTGFDPAYLPIALGNLCMSWAMQCAIERGLTRYEHLAGEQEHKRRRSTGSHLVHNLEVFARSSPRALLFRALRQVRRKVASL